MPQQNSQQQPSRDILADLEHHSQLLEAQVAKLTQALDHWRLLEAEYEALGDEISRTRKQFPNAATNATQEKSQKAELERIRRDFDGQLVDHKTVYELFGAPLGQTIPRSAEYIANAIGRRLDYVQQNTATLQKQVEAAENKLAAAQVILRPGMPAPGANSEGDGDDVELVEEGGSGDGDDFGPVTDIVEELDEDGNVVNFRLHTPSSTQPQVLEALKKAGIEEIPAGGPAEAAKATDTTRSTKQKPTVLEAAQKPKEEPRPQKQKFTPNTKPRKGVSFADDTKPDSDDATSSQPQSFAAQRLGNIMKSAKDQESLVNTASAIIPESETEDEAALRREMLEYSMSEIGPIVAQLDIEEGLSDDDEGYNDEYDDDDDDDDFDEDDEDQHGRSKYSVIDEAYRERMRELEEKLGVAPLANQSIIPPAPKPSSTVAKEDLAESLGRIRVSAIDTASAAADTNGSQSPKPSTPTSVLKGPKESSRAKSGAKSAGSDAKKVSFATELDVAPLDEAPVDSKGLAQVKGPAKPVVEPLSDVIERSSIQKPSSQATAPGVQKPKRVSRFRKERGDIGAVSGAANAAGPTALTEMLPKGPHQAPIRFLDEDRTVAPSGPEGQTHSESVVERQAVTDPKEPHVLDAHLLLQETATEYHRTRNRLIQQQGGFMKASESAVVPVSQDDGGPRISKFKAARLGKQFMNP